MKIFGHGKPIKKEKAVFVESRKPANAKYKIVLGKDLKVGDIIVHNRQRCVITFCHQESGAGSFDFGDGYISVHAKRLTGQVGFLEQEFWTFPECPTIVEH